VISGFYHEGDENSAVLGYYAVSSGNFLFWNNLLIDRLFQNVGKKLTTTCCIIMQKNAVLILKVVCFLE
jgi:hypothetical protein